MGFWKSMSGFICVEITSADPVAAIGYLNNDGISIYNVEYLNDLQIRFSIHRQNLHAVQRIIKQHGARIRIQSRLGIFWQGRSLIMRPVLLIAIAFIIFLAACLPSRVLFITVEGNENLPARLIIEKAEACGVRFGASRRDVRSEKMKNALLSVLPHLQWAGINTSGCTAKITVVEKTTERNNVSQMHGISSVVAARDGIIVSCTVSKGTPMCQPGDVVKAGQLLVSGYTDCGFKIKTTQADAEIKAQTYRTLQMLSPARTINRGQIINQETKYSLLIGKKLINLSKDSGISDSVCVKMYKEDYLTLPGGYRLPFALVTEESTYYSTEVAVSTVADYTWMEQAAEEYLQCQMIAGEIIWGTVSLQNENDICYLQGKYACREMIGLVKNEESIQDYGNHFREDR